MSRIFEPETASNGKAFGLVIDAREAFRSSPTGKGFCTASIIRELVQRGIPLTLLLEEGWENVGKGTQRPAHLPMLCAEGTTIVTFPRGPLWHLHALRFLRGNRGRYLSPTSFLVPALLGRSVPISIVIHDLIAFQQEPHDRKAKILEHLTLPRSLKYAKHVFCVSEATKKELLQRFPWVDSSKVVVVYEGPTTRYQVSGIRYQDGTKPYILSVGTLCPRKNQLRLIQAFSLLPEQLREKTKLILLGPRGWNDTEIVALAKKTPNVEWRGYVSDEERRSLLHHAAVFAYPSLAEGFGLPVLDALSLGVPTLTSNSSSLPEVAGDAALLIDPKNTEDIARGLERLLIDEKLREELRRKGPLQASKFSWERTVDLILKIVQIKTPHPRPHPSGEGKNKTSPLPGGEGQGEGTP